MTMPTRDSGYEDRLLEAWEETYKKGQLTLWALLALSSEPHYVGSLREAIDRLSRNTIQVEEQSLYRALRKLHDVEVVDYEKREGDRGPERKYYHLTPLGERLLKRFLERNIELLFSAELRNIIERSIGHAP